MSWCVVELVVVVLELEVVVVSLFAVADVVVVVVGWGPLCRWAIGAAGVAFWTVPLFPVNSVMEGGPVADGLRGPARRCPQRRRSTVENGEDRSRRRPPSPSAQAPTPSRCEAAANCTLSANVLALSKKTWCH